MLGSLVSCLRRSFSSSGPVVAVLLASVPLIGCGEDVLTSESRTQTEVTARSSNSSASTANQKLARYLALALNEPSLRSGLLQAMSASPHFEGKVLLDTDLPGPINGLIPQMARAGDVSVQKIQSLIETAPDLEMYLPVSEHRRSWKGDADYVVATVLEEGAAPFGVTPDGQEVTLSADDPPSTPTIVLVRAESFSPEGTIKESHLSSRNAANYSASADMIQPCSGDGSGVSTECSGGGGGGGGGSDYLCDDSYGYSPGGLRENDISEQTVCLKADNMHEPWPSGVPEFYLLIAGTNTGNSGDADKSKRLNIDPSFWDGVDEGEWTYGREELWVWRDDWGSNIKVQCFEDDADPSEWFNLTGSSTAHAETTWDVAPGVAVDFTAGWELGLDSADQDDNCGSGFIYEHYSDGDLHQIPHGPELENSDGTSDLRWYGEGKSTR